MLKQPLLANHSLMPQPPYLPMWVFVRSMKVLEEIYLILC